MVKKNRAVSAANSPQHATAAPSASSKKKKKEQANASAIAAGRSRSHSPAPAIAPAAAQAPLPRPPSPPPPSLRGDARASCRSSEESEYPPRVPPEHLAQLDQWRARNAPFLHLWETQARPLLWSTCERAKSAAHATGAHAAKRLRESLDPEAREMAAQLRAAHGLRNPHPAPDAWFMHLHPVGLGLKPWLPGRWNDWRPEEPVSYFDPHEIRVNCDLASDDWVLLPD